MPEFRLDLLRDKTRQAPATATNRPRPGFFSVMTTDTVGLVNGRLATNLDRAFPALVRDLQDGIYSGVLRMVPSAADAEDITQETFIRAYRALSGYESQQIRDLNLRGWVWTIALNLCRNAARSRGRRPRTVELDRDAFDPTPGPDALAIGHVEMDYWARMLDQLPTAQRKAVVLRHVVGLSYSEIAVATNRPAGTVKTDVHRGIKKLKEVTE